jgi:hypothetical protein
MHTSSAAAFTLVEYDKWKLYAAGFFFDMECVERIAAGVVIDNTGSPHAMKDIILEYSHLLFSEIQLHAEPADAVCTHLSLWC